MHEYVFVPKLNKKKPIATVILICAAALLILFASAKLPYTALWQGLSAICFVAAIYIANAYILREFEYKVVSRESGYDEEEQTITYDFVIQQKGRPVCRIGLDTIAEVAYESHEKGNKETKNNRTYTYVSEWMSKRICRLTFLDNAMEVPVPIVVRFLCDDTLFALLKNGINPQTEERYKELHSDYTKS